MYPGFLIFRRDFVSALLSGRANAVYRGQRGFDVRLLRLVCAEPGITPKAVSRRSLIEKTLASRILAELDTRGLTGRTPYTRDGRSVALRATPAGAKVAGDPARPGAALETELVAALSERERETLERLSGKLAVPPD